MVNSNNKKESSSVLTIVIIALVVVMIAMIGVLVFVLVSKDDSEADSKNVQKASEITKEVTTTTETVTTTEEPTTLLDITTFKTGEYTENGQTVESVLNDGGVKLEITDISENSVSFTYTAISSAPSNRIADVIVENAEIVDGQAKFTFDDDGWFNRGTGYIKFLPDGKVAVKTKITRRDSEAMWDIGELLHTLSFVE